MGTTEILLVAAVVLIPLAIAVAVTLWTLEPAARRAERANRSRKAASRNAGVTPVRTEEAKSDTRVGESADQDVRLN